ncbi:MAG: hypothetical protein RLZZ385_221 [Pseudomonadota bacterium]|jgi:hypothetical protein
MKKPAKLLLLGLSLLAISHSHTADNDKQLPVSEDTFKCLTDMTKAEGQAYFVDNLLGNLEATLAAAQSPEGGKFPAGSVVSMVPNEVMIKHQEGWNPATNDWEFFLLNVAAEGTTIASRGTVEVVNRAGSCMGCHQLAQPQWDLICSNTHGCAPIPFTREQIAGVQAQDPRCNREN